MEGLDKLFTVTDYSTVTISIPKSHVDGGSKDDDGAVKITLACSEAATTDYDLTGQILWPVSSELMLASFKIASLDAHDKFSNVCFILLLLSFVRSLFGVESRTATIAEKKCD
jgi:hypothetical protein